MILPGFTVFILGIGGCIRKGQPGTVVLASVPSERSIYWTFEYCEYHMFQPRLCESAHAVLFTGLGG